jgi:hypothetical protein
MKKPITLLALAFFSFSLYLNFFAKTYSTEPVNYVQKKVSSLSVATTEDVKADNKTALVQKEAARKEDELVAKGMNKK